jgi:gamma-glutamyltranspeptidase/glutathione hydrolase
MQQTSFDFNSRRSMVLGRRGMVATSNPLAAQSGLQILMQGGNAADAAVATAAVLNVTEPASTGIGGDCFALYFDAQTQEITALNGSGRAPAALNIDIASRANPDEIDVTSAHAVTVPGTVRGWEDLLAQHGTMPLSIVLKDAIHYARDGYPVHPVFASSWKRLENKLQRGTNTEEYLPAPNTGDIKRLPGLAKTLQAISEGGSEAFYTGPIAEAITKTLETLGGVMSLRDLEKHVSTWHTPITTDYRGVRVWECPPNGQGLAALQALNLASQWDIRDMSWDSPERMHILIESMRLAFADARQYITDMATNPPPLDFLLSPSYTRERANLIQRERAMTPPSFGVPTPSSDTVYLTVVDKHGNACSFINSLYYGFGSGIVANGTGIMLQNRGALFSLDPTHPNALAPGKRPYHTIIPGMATQDGELYCSFGVMGGFMQPQGHLQVISALVDDNLNPQQALNRPRFCLVDGSGGSIVALEEGVPVSTMSTLAEMGHRIKPVSGQGRAVFGDGHIIVRDPDSGVLYGGADPRKDGTIVAY